jgi:hypothetical protein
MSSSRCASGDGRRGRGRTVSVASFNLLAPLYVRPVDQRTGKVQPFASFDWISDEDSDVVLGDGHRLPKLLRALRACGADFICVQELQLEREEEGGGGGVNNDEYPPRGGTRRQQAAKKGKRSRKEDCHDGVDAHAPSSDSSSRRFVLPKWIAPLTGKSSGGDDENDDGPYGVVLPPQAELEKIAERNRRVLLADAAITSAIFYKSGRWDPIVAAPGGGTMTTTTTCVAGAFRERVGGCGCGGDDDDDDDDAAAGGTEDPPVVVITSVHLDARSEERRVQQLRYCLENCLSAFSDAAPYPPPCVIAGDCNCELLDGSCVAAFLVAAAEEEGGEEGGGGKCERLPSGGTDGGGESATPVPTMTRGGAPDPADDDNGRRGTRRRSAIRARECASALRLPLGSAPSGEQIRDWDELHDSVAEFVRRNDLELGRVDTGCTRAAYDHDDDDGPSSTTTSTSNATSTSTSTSDRDDGRRTMAQWRLDHILYTPSTLVPLSRWATLEDDDHSSSVGLPNDRIPTDHLPIAASFEMRSHPRLCDVSRRALIERLNEIEARHSSETKAEDDRIDMRREELSEKQRRSEEGGIESIGIVLMQSGKTNKKKKGSPSPEMIEHIRSSRAAVKEMKTRQRMERRHFVDEICSLERMVLRHLLGKTLTLSQWIEHGRAK